MLGGPSFQGERRGFWQGFLCRVRELPASWGLWPLGSCGSWLALIPEASFWEPSMTPLRSEQLQSLLAPPWCPRSGPHLADPPSWTFPSCHMGQPFLQSPSPSQPAQHTCPLSWGAIIWAFHLHSYLVALGTSQQPPRSSQQDGVLWLHNLLGPQRWVWVPLALPRPDCVWALGWSPRQPG